MRTIYHRFDDIFDWKRGWSMVYLIGNEADRWYIWLETRLIGQKWTEKWPLQLFEDEIAELLFWTEWKKFKNAQTYCSMDFIFFLRIICKKKRLFISLNRAEKYAKVLKKDCEEVSMLRTDKYFELITTVVRCEELCRSRRMLSTEGLQPRARWITSSSICYSSHPTHLHSIIAIYFCRYLWKQILAANPVILVSEVFTWFQDTVIHCPFGQLKVQCYLA